MNRKYRVMIACVTFETARISAPVEYYGANKVYLIHYVSRNHPSGIYQEFFDRTRELIKRQGDVEIVDVNHYVGDFTQMLRIVSTIIRKETNQNEGGCGSNSGEKAEIYVNLSCGSPEYIAAAATASMMSSGRVTAFFAKTGEYQIPNERLRDIYYDEDGNPVGMTKTVRGEEEMPAFTIEMPPEYLVRGLRVYKNMLDDVGEPDKVKSTAMVDKMRKAGCWTRKEGGNIANARTNNSVYYQRMYVDRWLDMGWVERVGGRRSGYVLTDSGRVAITALWSDEGLRSLLPHLADRPVDPVEFPLEFVHPGREHLQGGLGVCEFGLHPLESLQGLHETNVVVRAVFRDRIPTGTLHAPGDVHVEFHLLSAELDGETGAPYAVLLVLDLLLQLGDLPLAHLYDVVIGRHILDGAVECFFEGGLQIPEFGSEVGRGNPQHRGLVRIGLLCDRLVRRFQSFFYIVNGFFQYVDPALRHRSGDSEEG